MIDFYNLNTDDQKAWDLICTGKTCGIFQLDSYLGKSWAKKIKPRSIPELSDLVTLIRPGCLNAKLDDKTVIRHYMDRKNGKDPITPFHESIKDILANTYQLILYQEQQMDIAKRVAGFDDNKADKLRKSTGKKDVKLMQEVRTMFIDGCSSTNILKEEEANKLFDIIEKSARYLFNACLNPKTTFVETEDSVLISLDCVKIGDRIKAPADDSYGSEFVTVKNVYHNGEMEVFRFTLESGKQIECTLDHEFLCEDGKKRKIIDILEQNIEILCERSNEKQTERIVSVQKIGKMATVDIEVDNNRHVFFANGIATSNSHSVSYSIISYWTAYIKTYYPLQFYTTWLSHAKKRLKYEEEIESIISEAKDFGIEIRGPQLSFENCQFLIRDNKIYFGFDDIKGFRNTDIDKYKLHKPTTWLGFLSLNMNKSSVIGLIKSGALNYGMCRKTMLYEYDIWCELTDREKIPIITKNSLLEGLETLLTLDFKSGGCNAKRKLNIVEYIEKLKKPMFSLDDTIESIIEHEKESIRIPLTYSPLDSVEMPSNITIKEFNDGKDNKNMILPCIVKRVKEYPMKGKNAGAIMAFVDIEDTTGSLSAVAFPSVWSEFKSLLYEDNIVCLRGKRSKESSFQIVKVDG